jgi:hypothetical protein
LSLDFRNTKLFSVDDEEESVSSPGALSVPEDLPNTHKRSSSDAGVSYHVRPNRRALRRKEIGYQIIDQEGVSLADGRSKNIQSVLVCN